MHGKQGAHAKILLSKDAVLTKAPIFPVQCPQYRQSILLALKFVDIC
ncbi:hypothetical protein PRUB_b0808 [Pseudoalteromonas rubra]|uniref:Uncharacterized protein n=1 Tax=Pseudoalteromonas rubra TaxID=43658 RepID=A0A8T0C0Y3_9GAMM|nr:hypothetical protein PRUB_b0808 [Pseudoalteromonas rubra]